MGYKRDQWEAREKIYFSLGICFKTKLDLEKLRIVGNYHRYHLIAFNISFEEFVNESTSDRDWLFCTNDQTNNHRIAKDNI